jgi:hypothetical protein
MLLPAALAQGLELFPKVPEDAEHTSYETVGEITRMYRTEGALTTQAARGHREGIKVCPAKVAGSPEPGQPLLG